MTAWKAQFGLAYGNKNNETLVCGKDFVIYQDKVSELFKKTDLPYLESLKTFILFIQWEVLHMAESRWNPKPCVCFQRKGFGTILVVGNEVMEFDGNMNLIRTREVTTFFQGVQETMLLVGAVTTKFLEEIDEDG